MFDSMSEKDLDEGARYVFEKIEQSDRNEYGQYGSERREDGGQGYWMILWGV